MRHGSSTGREMCPAGRRAPARRTSIFRISSVTKPVVAVLAMRAGRRRAAVARRPRGRGCCPELADRRVLRSPDAPIDDTVPADRPSPCGTCSSSGWASAWTSPARSRARCSARSRSRVCPSGRPHRRPPLHPDEWMRIVGSVPLSHQPGARWLYNTGAQVLGVLVARAAGRPLPELLAERLLDPLRMTDTGFHVPPDQRGRFGRQWLGPDVYDEPDGQWSTPPAFPDAASGLVSTVADLHAFAASLRTADPVIRTARHGEHGDGRAGAWASASRSPTSPTVGTPAATAGTAAWARRGGPTRSPTRSRSCSPPTRGRQRSRRRCSPTSGVPRSGDGTGDVLLGARRLDEPLDQRDDGRVVPAVDAIEHDRPLGRVHPGLLEPAELRPRLPRH